MRHVKITWLDSQGYDGWVPLADVDSHKVKVIEGTGIVIYEDDDVISVTPHHGGDQVNGYMDIPKCCIREITEC